MSDTISGEVVPAVSPEMAAVAHTQHTQIQDTFRRMRQMWVQGAAQLYEFRTGELYIQLGYATFDAYLAEADLGLERRWIYELINIYKQLVVERGVPLEEVAEYAPAKLQEILPAVRRSLVTLDQALSDAGTMTKADLKAEYSGLVRGNKRTETFDAGYEEGDPYHWETCQSCGSMYKVRD